MRGILVVLFLIISSGAGAHPVTYKDGLMVKSMFREDMSENSLTYSFHQRLATGLEVDRLLLGNVDTTWAIAEFNALLQRWNGEGSQANIYLLSGAGGVFIKEHSEWAGKAGAVVDYETRRFYTAAQYSHWFSENIQTNYYVYRVGYAPFLAGYNDLNVWMVLQTDYNNDMRKNVQVSPILRFYFKNVLWEFGSSLRGNFFGQFMVHM